MSGQNNQQQNQVMIGDLPLIQSSHFSALGQEYWNSRGFFSWYASSDLERLQGVLHRNGRIQDADDVKNTLSLVSEYISSYYYQRRNNKKIPFHLDILPHWEAFAEQQKKRRELELFKIDKISIPTAPFFEQKLLPMLKKNDCLMTLELNNCDLGADDIAAVAKFIKKNKSLSTLDLSGNKINSPGAAKALAKAIKNHPDLSLVNLSGCQLGGYKNHTKVLSNILGGCKNLKSLLLDYNRIGIGGKDNEISTEEVTLVTDFIAPPIQALPSLVFLATILTMLMMHS
jgi:hypothetical protein